MIKSYRDKDTEAFGGGKSQKRFRAFERVAYRKLKPVHPGEILKEEFLDPMGLTQYRLAKAVHVPLRRINEIVLGRRGISADTALRLAVFLGTTPELWQNLQSQYEMDTVKSSLWKRIKESIIPLSRSAALF